MNDGFIDTLFICLHLGQLVCGISIREAAECPLVDKLRNINTLNVIGRLSLLSLSSLYFSFIGAYRYRYHYIRK